MSKRHEHSCVGQALAAACVERGIEAVTAEPRPLQFAFERAWRAWPHSARFPQIRSDAGWSSVDRVITDAGRTRRARAAWADHPRGFAPYLDPGCSVPILAAELESDSGLTWDQWQGLAQLFIEALPQDAVVTAPR